MVGFQGDESHGRIRNTSPEKNKHKFLGFPGHTGQVSPARIGVFPVQMAFPWLMNGGDPNHLQVMG